MNEAALSGAGRKPGFTERNGQNCCLDAAESNNKDEAPPDLGGTNDFLHENQFSSSQTLTNQTN